MLLALLLCICVISASALSRDGVKLEGLPQYELVRPPVYEPTSGHWFALGRQATPDGSYSRTPSDLTWDTLNVQVPLFIISNSSDQPDAFDPNALGKPYLATLRTRAEHLFVREQFKGVSAFIGATDNNDQSTKIAGNASQWVWTKASPEGRANISVGEEDGWNGWAPNHPSNNYNELGAAYARIDCEHDAMMVAEPFWPRLLFLVEWGQSLIDADSSPAAQSFPPWVAPDPPCFRGNRYEYVASAQTWEQARLEAIKLGGHLVTIRSNAEQLFIFTILAAVGPTEVWIGASDDDGTGEFRWNSSSPDDGILVYSANSNSATADFSLFLPYEPNGAAIENHVECLRCNGWNDIYGGKTSAFIVEFDSHSSCLSSPVTTGLSSSASPSGTSESTTTTAVIDTTESVTGLTTFSISSLSSSSRSSSTSASTLVESSGAFSFPLILVIAMALAAVLLLVILALGYVWCKLRRKELSQFDTIQTCRPPEEENRNAQIASVNYNTVPSHEPFSDVYMNTPNNGVVYNTVPVGAERSDAGGSVIYHTFI